MKTIFREITPVRRTSRPRASAAVSGGFLTMLFKLNNASTELKRTRSRRRRRA